MKYYTLLLLLIVLTIQADVYRTVDRQGNIIFSDTATENAEKIELKESFTYTPPVITDLIEGELQSPIPLEIPIPSYTIVITSPTQNETVRENAGNVIITSLISPALSVERADKLLFSLDGNLKSTAQDASSYTFTNVDRGSHIAVVSVVDKSGKTIKSSKSILFHLQRATSR